MRDTRVCMIIEFEERIPNKVTIESVKFGK